MSSLNTPPSSRPELRERVQQLRIPPAQKGPKTGGWSRLLLVLLAIWFFAAWWTGANDLFFRSFRGTTPAATASTASNSRQSRTRKSSEINSASQTAKTPAVQSKPDAIALEAKGYVIPAHQILVSPKVSGMITRLCVEEGLLMQKGDILAEIETTEYQAEYDRAVAIRDLNQQKLLELERGSRIQEIERARAELSEAKETQAEYEDQFARLEKLKASNATTEQAFIQAERRLFAQKQRVSQLIQSLKLIEEGPRVERIEAARAELRQAEAEILRARWRLDNCTIRAPISGTILKKNAEEGNIVNPVAFNGSFSLCDMADLSDLEISLDIQERDISKVFQGQVCRIRSEAFPNRNYEGKVDRLMPIADRAKGAIPVRVKVKVPKSEEGVYLKPEMGAIVTFLGTAPPIPDASQPTPDVSSTTKPDQSASSTP